MASKVPGRSPLNCRAKIGADQSNLLVDHGRPARHSNSHLEPSKPSGDSSLLISLDASGSHPLLHPLSLLLLGQPQESPHDRSDAFGHVGAVSGSAISIRQFEGVASGISIIGGRSYRVGQVGSFVRIPQGYHDLYGIIAEVGATATPEALQNLSSRGERWMTVQLVGEIVETAFERGISQYPAMNDEVHLVTEEDLAKIYGTAERGQVVIGRLAGAESIPVRIDLDRLVTRHSAVLGSTGAGKSTTIASLLRAIAYSAGGKPAFPNTRILLFDIHGEYRMP